MEKLILNNQSQLNIESGSSLFDMKVVSEDKYSMISTWDMMTNKNLKHIEIKSEDGIVIGTYDNIVLDSETSTIRPDGKILTSFHLREKTEVELLREEIEVLKEGQEVHSGAIEDLGNAVSDLAEGGLS